MGWKYYKKFNNIKELLIMDYKNKYNEALERARELSKTITGANYEYIFPELKEEDELRWLKNYISEEAYYLSMDIRDCEDRLKLQKLQKSLAWLEKQGEQKPVEWSEYDEHKVKDIIYFLNSAKKHYASTVELDACVRWLWSLLQRTGI